MFYSHSGDLVIKKRARLVASPLRFGLFLLKIGAIRGYIFFAGLAFFSGLIFISGLAVAVGSSAGVPM